ncbi:MAG: hypothetical protein Q9187_003979 [Circinaria calcarea]
MTDYSSSNSQQPFPRTGDESPGAVEFLYEGLSHKVLSIIRPQHSSSDWDEDQKYTKPASHAQSIWPGKLPSKTHIGLIIIWIVVLWWGERGAFSASISHCDWNTWEQWPSEAAPHHVVLIADPQLVDPHTYPGRPWPLSTLTTRHTDLYLRRSFSYLQSILDPSTVYFLGDLFDGGREWAAGSNYSPDKRWKGYGKKYWLQEYDRFGRIFLDRWNQRPSQKRRLRKDRKIIASLPGNHDLGLGNGIRLPVRQRFHTFFGVGDRVDVIANHTFVSIDTVSLSAKGQTDTQVVGPAHDGHQQAGVEIWGDTEEFLSSVKDKKAKAVDRVLRLMSGRDENLREDHTVLDLNGQIPPALNSVNSSSAELPTILLTHVPLYRPPGTPCGPLRERWPPSQKTDGTEEFLHKDDANAIQVAAGYQYQNVLQPDISNDLIEKIGKVEFVFSGDDHDYCEVVHRGFTSRGGGVREITVKSISWAMGVRKPGFLMLSLWNPIDESGHSINMSRGKEDASKGGVRTTTLNSHLCLLPDQLEIFIRYGVLLGLTIMVLVIQALVQLWHRPNELDKVNGHILRPDRSPSVSAKRYEMDSEESLYSSSSANISEQQAPKSLAIRWSGSRPRSSSAVCDHGTPMSEKAGGGDLRLDKATHGRHQRQSRTVHDEESQRGGRKGLPGAWHEIRQGFSIVAVVAIPWYIWLAWTS